MRRCYLLVIVLLVLPHFMTIRPWSIHFHFGFVQAGDEPHYLLLIGSLVEDGDVNVANNYANLHNGQTWNAGRFLRQDRRLDHHTYLLIDGERIAWSQFYQPMRVDSVEWVTDADGHFSRPLQPGQQAPPFGVPEYSSHQPGIAYLLGPLLVPVRGTRFLEPLALLTSALATFIAFVFYRRILRQLGAESRTVDVVSIAAFFGTSVWFYSRSLHMESYLLMCICGTYALALDRRRPLVAGSLVAIALHLKAYYLLMALPILLDAVIRRDYRYACKMMVPMACGGLLLLWQNAVLYGHPLTQSQPYRLGSFTEGVWGLLFSHAYGLIWFCPIVIAAILAWPGFLRSHRREALVLGTAFLLNFFLIANYLVWWGGCCYGPRYLTPFIPFLAAALVAVPRWTCLRGWRGMIFGVLLALSVWINARAVLHYEAFWEKHPLDRVLTWFASL